METRSFSFRALLLACAAVAGLVGAVSLLADDEGPPAAQAAAHLTAAQQAELQPAPAPPPARSPTPSAFDGDREPGGPDRFDGEEPLDGSGS